MIFVTHSIEEAAISRIRSCSCRHVREPCRKSSSPTLTAEEESGRDSAPDKNYLDAVDEIWQILKHYI